MNLAESQVESLFFAALEIQTPAERAAFLDGACRGNPELRQRVEQLLQAHPRVENFLHAEPPAAASGLIPTLDQSVAERPGTMIGPDVVRILDVSSAPPAGLPSLNLRQNMDWTERETVRRALESSGGVKKDAAEAMGISQRALSYYLAKHRVE